MNIKIALLALVAALTLTGMAFLYINPQIYKGLPKVPKEERYLKTTGLESFDCVDPNIFCKEKKDGTTCNYGVWCDSEGRRCGGKECENISLGVCKSGKCVPWEESSENQTLHVPSLPNAPWIIKDNTQEKIQTILPEVKTLTLIGKTYVYTRTFETNQKREEDKFSLTDFFAELDKLGWRNWVKVGDYTISVGHGDGPFDSYSGVLAHKDGKIRVVIHRVFSKVKSGSYPDIICPCQITNEVFISEETDLSDEMFR